MDLDNKTNKPHHIGIILDGNGRWALKQGKKRNYGHFIGTKNVFDIAKAASDMGIKYFSVYALSLENWKRPKEEINFLIDLFRNSIDEQVIRDNHVKFKVLGKMETLPPDLVDYFHRLENETKEATGMVFTICVSYSSKWEITNAFKSLFKYMKNNDIKIEQITENNINDFMQSNYLPDPDLIIRTGGEYRLSNFMLWQSSYSELYFTDKLWPDFRKEDLASAIHFFQSRERRYGNINV